VDLTDRSRPVVVVGVDGSGPAAAAAGAATAEARRRLLPLRLVRALPGSVTGAAGGADPADPADPAAQHPARSGPTRAAVTELAALRRTLLQHLPGGSISTALRTGPPVWVLLQEATSAELLVVGATGTGRPGPHVGAVAGAVARRSPCPVLVVRAAAAPETAGAPVVVVVDEGAGTGGLLSVAVLEAATRSTGLEVVAMRPPGTGDGDDGAALHAVVADLARTWPGVRVELRGPVERTVTTLVREARGAALLVVGRADPDGHPTGPPLRALLAGATASVLVVPTTRAPGHAPALVRALDVPHGART
jgi:nucleotide-binding universal stress UspA family protein